MNVGFRTILVVLFDRRFPNTQINPFINFAKSFPIQPGQSWMTSVDFCIDDGKPNAGHVENDYPEIRAFGKTAATQNI